MMSGTLGVIGGTLAGGAGAGSVSTPYVTHDESGAVTVTAGATSHTKGAWVEIIASTSTSSTVLIVDVNDIRTSSANTATLLDLAVGASGSEVAFVQNIAVGGATERTNGYYQFPLPVAIPAGSRISARTQAAIAADTATVQVTIASGGALDAPPASLDVLGTDTATSKGTQTTSGSWAEITASTPRPYRVLVAIPSLGTAAALAARAPVQIAKGPAGSEVQIAAISAATSSIEGIETVSGGSAWAIEGVPAGTRLSCQRTAACDVTLIGVA